MKLSLPLAELRSRIDRTISVGRIIAVAVRVAFERPPAADPEPPAPRPVLSPQEHDQTCAALARWQLYADWRRICGDKAAADRLDFGIALRRRLYGCDDR